MSYKFYIGVDPGKTGAIAVLDSNGAVYSLLDFQDKMDIFDLSIELSQESSHAYLEKVHSMPGQGVSSTFAFGENFGWWQGMFDAYRIEYDLVSPQSWQKGIVPKKNKKSDKPSLDIARKMFTEADLRLAKHHNRADALLIAYTCFTRLGGLQ